LRCCRCHRALLGDRYGRAPDRIQVIHLSFLPAFAVAEATAVLAGQRSAANRDDLVKRIARLADGGGRAYAFLWTLIFALARRGRRRFTPIGGHRDRGHAASHRPIFQMADAANVVARGTLRGTGDVRIPRLSGSSRRGFVPAPGLALGYRWGWGARGLAGADPGIIVAGVICGGAWNGGAGRRRPWAHGAAWPPISPRSDGA